MDSPCCSRCGRHTVELFAIADDLVCGDCMNDEDWHLWYASSGPIIDDDDERRDMAF